MINETPVKEVKNVCDLKYLIEMMHGKKQLINEVLNTFLIEISKELYNINKAIAEKNYSVIKNFAHTIMSSATVMGISALVPILKELEDLNITTFNIERIKELNIQLNSICQQAIEEIEWEKVNYT
jgi:HPt (histidine-containing phosphotransfer) domain-containing protein